MATKAAVAATIAMLVVRWLGTASGFWAALSALAVVQAQIGGSLVAARNYLIATAVGVVLGVGIVTAFGDSVLLGGVGIFVVVLLTSAMKLPPATASLAAGVIPVLVLAVTGEPWRYGVARMIDIAIGLLAAILVTFVLWPSRAVSELRRDVATAIGDAGSLATEALRALAAGAAPSGGDDVEARAARAIQAAQSMLGAARGEPLPAPAHDLLPFLIAHADRILEHAASVCELACLPLPQPAIASLSATLSETAAALDKTVAALRAAVVRGAAGTPLPDVRAPAASLRASVDSLRGADLGAWTADAGILTVHSLLTALDTLCREIERTIDRIEQPEGAVQPVERAYMAQETPHKEGRPAWWRRVRA